MADTTETSNCRRQGNSFEKTVPRLSESPVPMHLASKMSQEEWQRKMRLLEDVFTAAYKNVDINKMLHRVNARCLR